MEFLVDDPQHAYYKLSKTNLEWKAKLIEYIVKARNVFPDALPVHDFVDRYR